MRSTLIALFLLFGVMYAQAQGIQFQSVSFAEAQKLAKQENKLLFIDFYTVWCGPCKILARDVFTQPQIGSFFNQKFICCKLDAEKEGKELAQKLGVNAYPTLMFINSDIEVVNKIVGAVGVERLLEAGEKALEMKEDPNSYANLKKNYPLHRKDEKFLAMYIPRMVEYSESPAQAIEDYLKIQTGIKEEYAEMMEFFIAYAKYMRCGGKAEEIFQRNYNEYMDIATRSERRALERIYTTMVNNTYNTAMNTKDVELYKVFIDRWKKMPEKNYASDYNAYKLELIGLQENKALYLSEAEKFLDSLTTARTLADIHLKDSIRYADYCKNNKVIGMFAEAKKQANLNLDAGIQFRHMMKVIGNYLEWSDSKVGYKNMSRWFAYGKQLLTDQDGLADLEVKMLMKQGKKKQAIVAKEKLVNSLAPTSKRYGVHRAELEKMKGRK